MILDTLLSHMNLEKSFKLITTFQNGSIFPKRYWKYITYEFGTKLPLRRGSLVQRNILIRNHIRKCKSFLAGFRKIQRFLSNRPTPIRRPSFKEYLENHKLVEYEYRRNYN